MVIFSNGSEEEKQKKVKDRRESRMALIERSKMKQGGKNSVNDRFNHHNFESVKDQSDSREGQRHEMKDIKDNIKDDNLIEENSNKIELSSSESTCIDGDVADIDPRISSTTCTISKDKNKILILDTNLEAQDPVLVMHGSFEQMANGNNTSVSSPLTSLIAQDLFFDNNNISPKSAIRRSSLPLFLYHKEHDRSDSDGDIISTTSRPTKRVVRFGPASFPVSLRDIEQHSDFSPPRNCSKTTECFSSDDGMKSEQSADHSKDNAYDQSSDSSGILRSPRRKARRDSLPINMHFSSHT